MFLWPLVLLIYTLVVRLHENDGHYVVDQTLKFWGGLKLQDVTMTDQMQRADNDCSRVHEPESYRVRQTLIRAEGDEQVV